MKKKNWSTDESASKSKNIVETLMCSMDTLDVIWKKKKGEKETELKLIDPLLLVKFRILCAYFHTQWLYIESFEAGVDKPYATFENWDLLLPIGLLGIFLLFFCPSIRNDQFILIRLNFSRHYYCFSFVIRWQNKQNFFPFESKFVNGIPF